LERPLTSTQRHDCAGRVPAWLAQHADLSGKFPQPVEQNNISVTMFPQKDFICDG
jgi:hypothetical protein